MEIEYKGGNCVAVTNKKDVFITDPRLSEIGLKDVGATATVHLLTQEQFAASHGSESLVIQGPGEYEVRNCSIRGIAARKHTDDPDAPKSATIYRLDVEDTSIAIIGHIDPKLTDAQLEALGVIDILVVPVGNHGYTLDAKSAVDLIRKIEPKVVIPTHYAEEGIAYEVPQAAVEDFIKELGATVEEMPKVKVKSGLLPASLTVYKVTRTK